MESLKGTYQSEKLGIAGRVIFKWILWKWGGRVWISILTFRMGSSGPSGTAKGRELLD
jgi:hypothetical protein